MITLGAKARDKITGFEGIVVTRVQHMHGCARYALQPGLDKDGKVPSPKYFDEPSLIILDGPELNDDLPSGNVPG